MCVSLPLLSSYSPSSVSSEKAQHNHPSLSHDMGRRGQRLTTQGRKKGHGKEKKKRSINATAAYG
jgi:hypothetical protein